MSVYQSGQQTYVAANSFIPTNGTDASRAGGIELRKVTFASIAIVINNQYTEIYTMEAWHSNMREWFFIESIEICCNNASIPESLYEVVCDIVEFCNSLGIPYSFRLISSLNGNNGSHTNSDDVNMTQEKQDERKRANKEAKTHRVFGKNDTGKNNKSKPKNDSVPVESDKNEVVPDEEVKFFRNGHTGPYYDGAAYHDFVPEQSLVEKSATAIYAKRSWTGGYAIQESTKGKNVLVQQASTVEKVSIPGYYRRDGNGKDMFFAPREYLILNPLYESLRRLLSASKVDGSLQNAAFTLGRRIGPSRWEELVNDTVQFYLDIVHRTDSQIMGSTGLSEKIANNAEVIGYGDFGRIAQYGVLGTCHNLFAALEVEHCDWDKPIDYKVRTDFDVIKCTVPRDADGRFMFTKKLARNKGKRTQYFKLVGKNQQPFINYANNGLNLSAGLPRVLKQREGETAFRGSAMALGKAILCGSHRDYGRSLVRMYDELIGCRANREAYTECQSFVATEVNKLVRQCGPWPLRKVVDKMANAAAWGYYTLFEKMLTNLSPIIPRQAAASIPNIKKRLRQMIVNGIKCHVADDILVRNMKCAVKDELAKWGKAPRLYCSYGDGVMYANELPEFVKMCVDGSYVVARKGVTSVIFVMAKPKNDSMEYLFNQLFSAMQTPNFVYVAIYSDDSCYAGNVGGQQFGSNVDVSSNDSSQDVPAFLAVYMALARFNKELAQGLIQQCMVPMFIQNPDDPEEILRLKMHGPFLGSGTVLTTILNHFGSFMIACATVFWLSEGFSFEEAVKQGAFAVGHEVTQESWFEDGVLQFERAQFLKRSPAFSEGRWIPCINMGCILRSLGEVTGEIEPRHLGVTPAVFATMSMSARMDKFFSGVIAGWQHEASNPILVALRERFKSGSAEVVHEHDSMKYVLGEVQDYASEEGDNLVGRYGLERSEIAELCAQIRGIQFGQFYSSSAISKIMHRDYGVPIEL